MSDADQDTTISGGQRVTTLMLVSEAKIAKKVPVYDPEKGVANHKSLLKYVKSAHEGATEELLIQRGLGTPSDIELGDVWKRYADKHIAPGALDDATTAKLIPAAGAERTLVVDLQNRLTAAKSGVYFSRLHRSDSVEFRNAADLLTMQTLLGDYKEYLRDNDTGAKVLNEETVDKFFDKVLSDSRSFSRANLNRALPTDYTSVNRYASTVRESIAESLVLSDPDVTIAEALEEASIEDLSRVLDALRAGDKVEQLASERLERIILSRSYNEFLQGMMDRMYDVQHQRKYEQKIADSQSASVYKEKKNIPDTHIAAARASQFLTSGDFKHLEIDESVDLEVLKEIEREWEKLRELVPHTDQKATLRFRKTGRHRAAGVYHPSHGNIAVDPRHPSSFIHEYLHHLDYTMMSPDQTGLGKGKRSQLSLSTEYMKLLHKVQKEMRNHPELAANTKLDYYTTPTEVFARGGELALYWSGVRTSLSGDEEKYSQPVYQAYEPYREQIIEYYEQHLGLGRSLDLENGKPLLANVHAAEPSQPGAIYQSPDQQRTGLGI
jgi:hypothetical protein